MARNSGNDRGIAVRIGLHKCGTTFLQDRFFVHHHDLLHLGKPYAQDDPIRRLIESIVGVGDEYDETACRATADRHVLAQCGDRLVTLSDGRLARPGKLGARLIAQRLRTAIGPARIILMVRRQEDFLKSFYVQYRSVGVTDLPFNDWLSENWDDAYRLIAAIDYAEILTAYDDAFGRDSVCFELLENLQDDAIGFADRISAFLSVDAGVTRSLVARKASNERPSRIQVALRKTPVLYAAARSVLHAMPSSLQSAAAKAVGHDKKYDPEPSHEWKETIRAASRETNLRLQTMRSLNLAEKGYVL